MQNKDIYIVGIGHNSIVTIELAELNGYSIKGLIHYNNELVGQDKWGFPIISDTNSFLNKNIQGYNFALSMGDNNIREILYCQLKKLGGKLPILIHPTASVSKYSVLEAGVQVHANTTIQPDVLIKENSIISFGVGITHNVTINKNCYIAGHSIIGAYTTIENNVFIGMGATTVSKKVSKIGGNSVVGAGSLLINSVAPHKTVYGHPAK